MNASSILHLIGFTLTGLFKRIHAKTKETIWLTFWEAFTGSLVANNCRMNWLF